MRDGDWVHHNGPYEVFHALLYIPGKPPLNLMGDKMIAFYPGAGGSVLERYAGRGDQTIDGGRRVGFRDPASAIWPEAMGLH